MDFFLLIDEWKLSLFGGGSKSTLVNPDSPDTTDNPDNKPKDNVRLL